MTLHDRIAAKIQSVFAPQHWELINESRNHRGAPDAETHFKLLVVSKQFEGKTLLDRHRLVYSLLDAEMKDGVHALTLQVHTPQEWILNPANRKSPACRGGSDTH